MAFTRFHFSGPAVNDGRPLCYYLCDTASDLPSSGLFAGEIATTVDTPKIFMATDGTTWRELTKAGAGGYAGTGMLGSGTANNTTFLRGDNTWAAPPGGDGASLPAGCILMWHGLLASIPAGFVLCDGQNGTPDLRDKFVKGAAAATEAGATGGAATHTHADHAALVHAGTAVADHASHTHTYSEIVNHTHPVTDPGHTHIQNAHSHVITSQTATTGSATSYEHGALDTSSAEAEATETTNPATAVNQSATTGITTGNPVGGVASGTTAGPSATLTHSVTQPNNHAAQSHQAANSEPPYFAVLFIMKT